MNACVEVQSGGNPFVIYGETRVCGICGESFLAEVRVSQELLRMTGKDAKDFLSETILHCEVPE